MNLGVEWDPSWYHCGNDVSNCKNSKNYKSNRNDDVEKDSE